MKHVIPFLTRNRITLVLLSCCLCDLNTGRAEDNDDYYFDPSLIRGNTLTNSALQTFNTRNAIPPGVYKVDLLVNDQFIAQTSVPFKEDKNGKISACLTPEQIRLTGLKEEPELSGNTECYFPDEI